ncbi:ESPR-type extended signal peptide-containing protein [Burkholderia cenocepacia]|uniref:ESPR-type extended signal peptide-containing protein n=1 Tax=Burkholderia cenocepacia TaxID=95486 RepID=UPI000D0C1119|nr:ESPR-type extended signal peptide-containing protein [Burkholderia cenocepacia]SOT42177.1 putative haemagglutinin-related autotransporter protein [Burkholderia cenocepacia]
MNKTYRSIWNAVTNTWTAAAETAKSHSKGSSRAARHAVIALALGGAAIGSAAAAEVCTTSDGASGMVDVAGVCKPAAAGALGTMGTVGTMAAIDDTYIKIGTSSGANAAQAAASAIAVGANTTASGTYSTAFGNGTLASGNNSTAIGFTATSTGGASVAFGGTATADHSSALGYGAMASHKESVAVGTASTTDRENSVSVGSSALRRQITNVAAGTQDYDAVNLSQMNTALSKKVDNDYVKVNGTVAATATVAGAVAIGHNANADATGAVYAATAIGSNATAVGNALAVGASSNAVSRGVAIGGGASASANRTTALGYLTKATAENAVAIGGSANAQDVNSVALGVSSTTDRENSVSVGSAALQRQITNMAAGTKSTDAVNVSQLEPVVTAFGGGAAIDPATGAVTGPTYTLANGGTQTTIGGAFGALDTALTTANGNIKQNADNITDINKQLGELSSGTIGLVQQAHTGADITVGANTEGAAVNFAGKTSNRKLTGVDAGDVSATSTDAINGSQLHGVSESVASAIGGGATVNADGSISAPSFTVGDGSGGTKVVNSVGDVVTNLDGRVTTNEGGLKKLSEQLESGTLGLVQQNPTTGGITVGANTGGTTVNFAGTGGTLRTLTGVANGVDDDDVVTVSQLRATGLIDYTGKEVGAVTYDSGLSFDSVTFAGSNGTVLHRVAAGEVSASSMDAVNGSQLYDLQERFAEQYDRLSGQVGDLSNRFDDMAERLGDLETNPGTGGPGTGGDGSLIVGEGAVASGENSSAIGQDALASGSNSSAIGQGSVASGENSSAVGQGSVASGKNGSAIGQGSVASGENGTALGQNAAASGSNSTALGQNAAASGSNSSAVGQGSVASGNNSVALGAGSVADRDNAVSVGSAGNERQITNVAAGTAPTDAVNVQQMNNTVSSARQDAMGGVAAAMAVAGLPQSTLPGRTFVSMAGSTYGGEYGSAMGLSYMTRDGKWTVKAAVNTSSRGEVGGVIGGGFYW